MRGQSAADMEADAAAAVSAVSTSVVHTKESVPGYCGARPRGYAGQGSRRCRVVGRRRRARGGGARGGRVGSCRWGALRRLPKRRSGARPRPGRATAAAMASASSFAWVTFDFPRRCRRFGRCCFWCRRTRATPSSPRPRVPPKL